MCLYLAFRLFRLVAFASPLRISYEICLLYSFRRLFFVLVCGSAPAVRGYVSSRAGLLLAAKVRHRDPDGSRHHPNHPRCHVRGTHPRQVRQETEAEGLIAGEKCRVA